MTTFNGIKYTQESIEAMSLSQMAGLYNEVASLVKVPTIKKFSDKEAGVRRTLNILNDYQEIANENQPKAEPKPKGEKKQRELVINYPLRRDVREVKADSTLLGMMLPVLAAGATLEQMDAVVIKHDEERGAKPFNVRARAIKTARRLSRRGYGVKLENGVVTLTTKG